MMTLGLVTDIDAGLLLEAREIREDLHRNPELAYQERRTASLIAERLRDWGVEVIAEGMAGTGVVGMLQGDRPGGCVGLRAEMDALPITEESGLEYASVNPGVMHACGHDGHMSILLTSARVLAGLKREIAGVIKFIFQPGEEFDGGAKKMVAAGLLRDKPEIQAIFALHSRPQIGPGQIELDPIPSAASNAFEIRILGKSTHAAYPHEGTDPIAIGSQIVTALQQVVSRQVAPFDTVVVTVGSFQAGNRGNVIPPEALLRGTIRTRDPQLRDRVIESVTRIAEGCAGALGGRARIEFKTGYPRVRNHPGLMDLVRRTGVDLLGPENVLDATRPTMGAEDFAFYLEEQGGVPGCLLRLGVQTDEPVHSAFFDFGHEALQTGILMMTNIAVQYLNEGTR
jgi:amidohydrolase